MSFARTLAQAGAKDLNHAILLCSVRRAAQAKRLDLMNKPKTMAKPTGRETEPEQRPISPWHSRGYQPHFDKPGAVQSVTFRLHDSLPRDLLKLWRTRLATHVPQIRSALLLRIVRYEDAGYGACCLRDPKLAELVENALLWFDAKRYCLIEWCIMPNHVHALVETFCGHSMTSVMHTWKSYTARRINQELGCKGALWMPDYFDRYIRDAWHGEVVRRYIRSNPVKAGLCKSVGEWRWSSAWQGRQ